MKYAEAVDLEAVHFMPLNWDGNMHSLPAITSTGRSLRLSSGAGERSSNMMVEQSPRCFAITVSSPIVEAKKLSMLALEDMLYDLANCPLGESEVMVIAGPEQEVDLGRDAFREVVVRTVEDSSLAVMGVATSGVLPPNLSEFAGKERAGFTVLVHQYARERLDEG